MEKPNRKLPSQKTLNLLSEFDATAETVKFVANNGLILRNARLVEIDNVWVLLYKDREYIRLLDAKSRDDAEQQIAELLLLRDTDQQSFHHSVHTSS